MNKVAQYYRELVASLTERLKNGERDIDELVAGAEKRLNEAGELTRGEVEQVIQVVRRDLESSPAVTRKARASLPTASLCGSSRRACGRSWRILRIKPSWNGEKCLKTSAITVSTTAVRWLGWVTWCANSATIIWRFTRRKCCRCALSAAMTSSSVGLSNPEFAPSFFLPGKSE